MAFVYAYIQCFYGPVNWFSLICLHFDTSLLLLTVTLRGYLISIAYRLFFILPEFVHLHGQQLSGVLEKFSFTSSFFG